MAQPPTEARPLLAGLPDRGKALQRQRANLVAFANDPANAEAFAAMPYEKWTTVPADADGSNGLQFEARASTLVPGLRGVFPRQPVPASPQEVRLLAYHGLLVTHALYQSFYEKFYCPTGLEVPALQFKGENGRSVCVTLIGDPTALAALINDGRYGRKDDSALNCCLRACSKKDLSTVLTLQPSGKLLVSGGVSSVKTMADKALLPSDELLLDYGKGFWLTQRPHCAVCFVRDEEEETITNPLVMCSAAVHHGTRSACSVARHRNCFADPPTLADLAAGSGVDFYCPNHLAQLSPPAPAVRLPFTPVAPRGLGAVPLDEPPWTPPPNRAINASPPPTAAAATPSSGSSRASLSEPQWTPPSLSRASSPAPAAAASSSSRSRPATAPSAAITSSASAPAAAAASRCSRGLSEPAWSPPERKPSLSDLEPSSSRPAALRSISFDHSVSSSKPDTQTRFYHASRNFGRAIRGGTRSDSDFDSGFDSEHSASASDFGKGLDSEASDSEEMEMRPRSFGRRSAAPRAAPGSGENSHSVAASVQEAKALGNAANGTMERASLTVRFPDQAQTKLRNYGEHATLNDAQWTSCLREFNLFAQRGRVEDDRPWFITKQDAKPFLPMRKPRKNSRAAASAAVGGGALVRSNSVGSAFSADRVVSMEIDGEEDAMDAASVATSRATTNRWRSRKHLAHDYAEYRSCCGDSKKWAPQLLAVGLPDPTLVADHPSHSPQAFFKSRLSYRSQFADRKSYDQTVAAELVHAKPRWKGYEVCCSCFRAALGVGRDALFRVSKLVVSNALEVAPKLTQSGALKKKRKSKLRDRVVALLRGFCISHGQSAPNPSTADLSRRRFILPQKQMPELAAALLAYEQEVTTAPSESLSLSAIYRAIKFLEERESHFISLGKGNSLCRCAVCDKLDNQCTPMYIKENKLSRKDVLKFKEQKLSHLAQMREQREDFDKHKEAAMLQPLEEWCITFDGMDQSKTQLPSRARFSKDLEPLTRLKLHWIGAFCFGGPDPVLGLMNTPELRKDAALSVVTLEQILDSQWKELERLHCAGVRVANSRAASESQASEACDDSKMEDLERGDASTLDSSAAAYSGPGMKWPKRLHLTFDNASGECKNQWMMRFLGLLVFHGVFDAITASMLLVGHTHDIVDQMFSVWARMLRIYNAETYEKMRDLFRERYHSRIDGLVALMRGREEALAALTKEEREAWQDEIREAGADWSHEQADILADFSAFVKQHNLPRPNIIHQTVTIDVAGWLCKAVAAKQPPPLHGISNAYKFGVEKDKHGNVYLFNSQFANSTEVATGPAQHNCRDQKTGHYSTRALLYSASDPGLSTDPYRVPPLAIDLTPLRATVMKYVEHKAMNLKERGEFDAMLDRLEEGQAKQKADCQACYDALTTFGQHGVVSQRARATDEEKKEANRKISARAKSWSALQAHLRDPAFAAVHDAGMVHAGFWTKWLQRKREHIQPAYIERGVVPNPADRAEPYHAAATELCSGVGEPPVHSDRAARIDLVYLHQYGTPAVGQVAIQRTAEAREPFYVCKITAVRHSEHAIRKMHIQPELQHAEMDQAAAAAEPVTIQPAVAAAAAAIAEQPEGGRGSQRLKDLEFEVKYYDLCPEDFENRHLTADSHTAAEKEAHTCWWRKQFAKQDPPQTEEALTAALTYARKHRKPAPPRPRWLVETYQDSRFLFVSKDSTWIPGGTLVAWGAESNLLKAAGHTEPHRRGHMLWQLRATVWRQLQEDLTELKVDDLRVSETPSSKLKPTKLKRKKGGCEDNEDDSDEASADMRERSGGAAAAAPRPPRHPRSAHAVAPIVDQQDDEGIASEEEEEEVAAAAAAAADSAEDVELEKETEIEDDAPLASYKPPDTNQTTQSAKTRGKTNKPAAAAASAAAKPHLRHRKRQRQQTNSKRK